MAIYEKIRRMLKSDTKDKLIEASDFQFKFRAYVKFLHNLLEMSIAAGTEFEDLMVVRDLVQHAFEEVREYRVILK